MGKGPTLVGIVMASVIVAVAMPGSAWHLDDELEDVYTGHGTTINKENTLPYEIKGCGGNTLDSADCGPVQWSGLPIVFKYGCGFNIDTTRDMEGLAYNFDDSLDFTWTCLVIDGAIQEGPARGIDREPNDIVEMSGVGDAPTSCWPFTCTAAGSWDVYLYVDDDIL